MANVLKNDWKDLLDDEFNKEYYQTLRNFLSGFVMVNNRLKNILENYGVVQIDCLNKPFDPSFHSALETVEKSDGL